MQITTYKRSLKITPRIYSSREEAIERAKAVASALYKFQERRVYIRTKSGSYYLDEWDGVRASARYNRSVWTNTTPKDASIDIIARLIAAGEARLQERTKAIREQLRSYPEIVAELRLAANGERDDLQALAEVIARKKAELLSLFKGIPIPDGVRISLESDALFPVRIDVELYKDSAYVTTYTDSLKKQISFLKQYDRIVEHLRKLRELFR